MMHIGKLNKETRRSGFCYFGLQGITTSEVQFLRLLGRIYLHWQHRERYYLWSLMRQTQMYQRLLLLYLLDLQSSPTVLPSLLSHPVETMAGPSEKHLCFVNPLFGTQLNLLKQLGHNAVYFINILLVDLAGVEPASRILFTLLHTVLTITYHWVRNYVCNLV